MSIETKSMVVLLVVLTPVIALAVGVICAVFGALRHRRHRHRLRPMTEGEIALRQRPFSGDVRTFIDREIAWLTDAKGTTWHR